MSNGKDDTEQNAKTSDNNISDAEEGVATTNNTASSDYDRLGCLVVENRETCNIGSVKILVTRGGNYSRSSMMTS